MAASKSGRNLAAVVLAAGNSERLGQSKQQLQLHKVALLRRAAEQALQVTDQAVVVLGAGHLTDRKLLDGLPLRITINTDSHIGLGGSIACGTAQLDQQVDAVLLLLVDQYQLTTSNIESLVHQWHSNPEQIAAASYAGTHGPPVIFPYRYFAKLKALRKDGAKSLLVEQPMTSVVMPSAAANLNTPADLVKMRHFEQTRIEPAGSDAAADNEND